MNAKTYEVLKTTPRRDGSYLVMLRQGGSATWNGPGELREGERVHLIDGKVIRGRQ